MDRDGLATLQPGIASPIRVQERLLQHFFAVSVILIWWTGTAKPLRHPAVCSIHRAQCDAHRDSADGNQSPERDEQLACERHDRRRFAGALCRRAGNHWVSSLFFWNLRKRQANWISPRRTRALPASANPFSRRFDPLSSGEPVRPASPDTPETQRGRLKRMTQALCFAAQCTKSSLGLGYRKPLSVRVQP